MATVTGDERPAPALTQSVLVTAATQTLVVEEAGAGAKLRVLQRRANVPVNIRIRTNASQMWNINTE